MPFRRRPWYSRDMGRRRRSATKRSTIRRRGLVSAEREKAETEKQKMIEIRLNDNAFEQDIRELLMAFYPGRILFLPAGSGVPPGGGRRRKRRRDRVWMSLRLFRIRTPDDEPAPAGSAWSLPRRLRRKLAWSFGPGAGGGSWPGGLGPGGCAKSNPERTRCRQCRKAGDRRPKTG